MAGRPAFGLRLLLPLFLLSAPAIARAEELPTAETAAQALTGGAAGETTEAATEGTTAHRSRPQNITIRLLAPEYGSLQELASPLELLRATLEYTLATPQLRSLPVAIEPESDALACDYKHSMQRIIDLKCRDNSAASAGRRPRLIVGPICSYAVNNVYLWYRNNDTDAMITSGGHSMSFREKQYAQLVRIGTAADQDMLALLAASRWLSAGTWKSVFFVLRSMLNPTSSVQPRHSAGPRFYLDSIQCKNLQKALQYHFKANKQFVYEDFTLDSNVMEDVAPSEQDRQNVYTQIFLKKIGTGRARKSDDPDHSAVDSPQLLSSLRQLASILS